MASPHISGESSSISITAGSSSSKEVKVLIYIVHNTTSVSGCGSWRAVYWLLEKQSEKAVQKGLMHAVHSYPALNLKDDALFLYHKTKLQSVWSSVLCQSQVELRSFNLSFRIDKPNLSSQSLSVLALFRKVIAHISFISSLVSQRHIV